MYYFHLKCNIIIFTPSKFSHSLVKNYHLCLANLFDLNYEQMNFGHL